MWRATSGVRGLLARLRWNPGYLKGLSKLRVAVLRSVWNLITGSFSSCYSCFIAFFKKFKTVAIQWFGFLEAWNCPHPLPNLPNPAQPCPMSTVCVAVVVIVITKKHKVIS